jgi:hypothetical protein
MMHPLLALIPMSLAVYAISVTVTTSVLFRDLRKRIRLRNTTAGNLVSCPYCFSHWTAFLVCGLSNVQLGITPNLFLNWVFVSLAVVGLANLFSYTFLKLSGFRPE